MLKVIFGFFLLFNTVSLCLADDWMLELKKGWNFISFPLNPADPSIEKVFSSVDGKYTNIWLYDSSDSANIWKHYHPDYAAFSDLTTISAGRVYWVEAGEDCSLTAAGAPIESLFSLKLKAGWNAFGWPYPEARSVQSALSSLTFGKDYSRLCYFDSQSKSFRDYFNNPELNQFNSFEPGGAYYIYLLQEQTIAFSPVVSRTLTVSVSPQRWNIGWISPGAVITMQDADKIRVVNNGDGKESYSLSVTSPDGWTAGLQAGPETYLLNAAFSKDSANINWRQGYHPVTAMPVISTETRFAGDENGVNVLPGQTRTLFLRFEPPAQTKAADPQTIILTISAEVPVE